MVRGELLDIVNENDEIVGRDTRDNVHKNGLLHREIHIWFVTPDGKIILQHRGKDAETYPDLLDATVGGHVELGMSYEDTAIKEMAEETGIHANIENLISLKKLRIRSVDPVTGKINNTFRSQYAYIYNGDISDLKVENGKAIGFEAWPIKMILNLNPEDKKKFIPVIFSEEHIDIFKQMERLTASNN